MSASIMWKYDEPEGKSLGVSAPSSFMETMRRAFGEHPWTLNPSHIERLRGMGDSFGGKDCDNPFYRLCDHLEDGGAVRVWAEY